MLVELKWHSFQHYLPLAVLCARVCVFLLKFYAQRFMSVNCSKCRSFWVFVCSFFFTFQSCNGCEVLSAGNILSDEW